MKENLSLHHVGIVAPTEQYAQDLMSLLGLEEEHRGYVPEYKSLCKQNKVLPSYSYLNFLYWCIPPRYLLSPNKDKPKR